jgi:hypothetical protein
VELKDDTPEGYFEKAKTVLKTRFQKEQFLPGNWSERKRAE